MNHNSGAISIEQGHWPIGKCASAQPAFQTAFTRGVRTQIRRITRMGSVRILPAMLVPARVPVRPCTGKVRRCALAHRMDMQAMVARCNARCGHINPQSVG